MGTIGSLDHTMRHLTRSELAKTLAYCNGEHLPGRPEQYIDEDSLLQNFVIGTRRVAGMTVYHYAKMEATKAIDNDARQFRGAGSTLGLDEQNTSALPASVAVGATTLSILDAASAAHAYKNAKITIWPAALEWQVFDVVDSLASDGTNVLLYLNRPVRVAIAAGTFTSIYRSPYSSIGSLADIATGLAAARGIPQAYVTTGYYFWLPTYGLVNITQGEALNGVGGPEVVFSPVDGAGWKLATSVAAANSWQRAGHMVAEQTLGIDCAIWLELDP